MAGASLSGPTVVGASQQSCSDEGATRSCSKKLGQHGSILSCYYGTETCISGTWSDCEDGTVVAQSLPGTAGNHGQLASISMPTPCTENLCDPTCQRYIEIPGTGLTAQAGNATWQTGNIDGFDATVQNLVSKPNCETASDCQQNQHCVNVATDAECAHDKCLAGETLSATCNDPCVSKVCDINAACCSSQPQCIDKRDLGPDHIFLGPDGLHCFQLNDDTWAYNDARNICMSIGPGWDLACVTSKEEQELLSASWSYDSWLGIERISYNDSTSAFRCVNGLTPLANGLIQGQWPWNAGEPNYWQGNRENCTELYASGLWNDNSCSLEIPSWCEGPTESQGGWTNDCAALVDSVCGVTCNTTNVTPPPPAACVAWAAGETSPNADTPDLALGVPCQGQIPVCNHGNAVAPAGAVVHVLPTTNPFGTANATLELGSCSTTKTIVPGACTMVNGCADLLNQEVELWVGYPSGTVSEARTDDNWGYSTSDSTCSAPQCLSNLGECFTSVTQTFEYQGLCPRTDQVPQWSYLTYASSTPGDSSIVFSVTAAPTSAQLASEPSVRLLTVSRAAANERCDLNAPTRTCPVDLYKALSPLATTHAAVLRLTVTLNPSSGGLQSPVLSNWKISYSCLAGT